MSKKIRRRGFLAGCGAALSLPLLESVVFTDRKARAAGESAVFTVFFKQGNGVQQARGSEPERFWPRELGPISPSILRDQNGDRAVSVLADHGDRLLLVRGLDMPYPTGSCGHARGLAQLLTCAPVLVGDKDARASHESVDYFIARNCNEGGAPPLHFAAGPVEGNYVSGTLSYRGNNDPFPAQNNPYAAYIDLFGDGTPMLEDQLAVQRRSVNDLVRTELNELLGSAQLGEADKRRLRDHLDFIRDIEVRMCEALPDGAVMRMQEVRDALTDNDTRPEIMRIFMDITAVAFACGLNRSAALQMGQGNDATRYYVDGVRQNTYHRISHRIDSDGGEGPPIPNADVLHHEIDKIHAGMFLHLLDRLTMYTGPGGGDLLEDTVAVWCNDLSNGPPHAINGMPFVIAGSGGGFLRTGQYVDQGGQTHNKLMNTIISAHGLTNGSGGFYDSFGDDSLERGVLTDLLA